MKRLSIVLLATIFLMPCGIAATALNDACITGNLQEVEKLISEGAKVDATDNNSWTPLHYAAFYGNEKVAQALLDKGAKVNATDEDGYTPLYSAVNNGNVQVVKVLLNVKDIDANIQDKNDYTPLYYAIRNGHEQIVKILVDRGAKVDIQDKDGYTPLHKAVINGNEQIVKELAAAPIAPITLLNQKEFYENHLRELQQFIAMKNNYGETAIDIARVPSKDTIFNYLTAIKDAPSYDDLDQDLRTKTERNYQR